MRDPFAERLKQLVDAIGSGPGEPDAGLRKDLLAGKAVAGALGAFAIKVSENASSITDEHVRALVNAGYSEEQVFECIIAAAVGAGLTRLRHGLALLGARG